MKYYPISRVITGSRSTGTELYLNGKPYTGVYYRTWDNNYYTGNDPVTGDSQKLEYLTKYVPTQEDYDIDRTGGYTRANEGISENYNEVKNVTLLNLEGFSSINSYYPTPSNLDYRRGFFYRYFAKKRNENGNIIEVNYDVFDSLNSVESRYNYELYHSIEMYWQLTGPLKDSANPVTGIITFGIEDTNKRITTTKDQNFKGLIAYIGENYSKFAKVSM